MSQKLTNPITIPRMGALHRTMFRCQPAPWALYASFAMVAGCLAVPIYFLNESLRIQLAIIAGLLLVLVFSAAMVPSLRLLDSTRVSLVVESRRVSLSRARSGKLIASLVLRENTPVRRSRDGKALLLGHIDFISRLMADWRPMFVLNTDADMMVLRGIKDIDVTEDAIRTAIHAIKARSRSGKD